MCTLEFSAWIKGANAKQRRRWHRLGYHKKVAQWQLMDIAYEAHSSGSSWRSSVCFQLNVNMVYREVTLGLAAKISAWGKGQYHNSAMPAFFLKVSHISQGLALWRAKTLQRCQQDCGIQKAEILLGCQISQDFGVPDWNFVGCWATTLKSYRISSKKANLTRFWPFLGGIFSPLVLT